MPWVAGIARLATEPRSIVTCHASSGQALRKPYWSLLRLGHQSSWHACKEPNAGKNICISNCPGNTLPPPYRLQSSCPYLSVNYIPGSPQSAKHKALAGCYPHSSPVADATRQPASRKFEEEIRATGVAPAEVLH